MTVEPDSIGYSAKIWIATDTTASTATVEFADIYNIAPPEMSRGDVDVTTYQSANRMKEYIPGLWDPGDFSFDATLVLTGATATLIATLMGETKSRYIEIRFDQLDTPSKVTFRGYLKTVGQASPLEDKMVQTLVFKPTTKPTIV